MHEIEDDIEKYSPVLGKELAFQFVWTRHEIFSLRSNWRTYREFFGNHKERFELFFEVSGTTAQTLERTLFEMTLVQMRRLTDPAKTMGKNRNVTIQAFEQCLVEEEQSEMASLVKDALQKTEFARDWVNRRIVHNDLGYRSGQKPLKKASRRKVEEAIDAIVRPIKWIAAKKCDFTMVTHPISAIRDESFFVRHLYEGQLALEAKRAQAIRFKNERRYEEAMQLLDDYPKWLRRSPDEIDTEI